MSRDTKRRRQEDGQKPGFHQEIIPLEAQEIRANLNKGKVGGPQEEVAASPTISQRTDYRYCLRRSERARRKRREPRSEAKVED